MRKIAEVVSLGGLLLLMVCGQSVAQAWPSWADDVFGRHPGYDRRWDAPKRSGPPPEPRSGARGGDIRDGGARPEIAPVAPPLVAFPHDFPANSIVIDSGGRKLYYVLPNKQAYQYPISVGREGFNWTGTETVSRKQGWPDWYPPAEMRERDPALPEKMNGGLRNPLGAMALYLGTTLYRIHGTNDVKSIGSAQSSGCFRMLNSAVMHLASITEIGTTVSVVASLPAQPAEIVRAPEPPVAPAISPKEPPPPAATADKQVPPTDGPPDFRTLRERTIEQAFGKR
jgi:lipoprotein-anchoring transpeptidase ErfK/SrfK